MRMTHKWLFDKKVEIEVWVWEDESVTPNF